MSSKNWSRAFAAGAPRFATKIRIEPIDLNTRTLAEHYRRKLARNHQFRRGLADELLRRIFGTLRPRQGQHAPLLSCALTETRWSTPSPANWQWSAYSIHQILRILIERQRVPEAVLYRATGAMP